MKKLVVMVALAAMLNGTGATNVCNHVHDEECGYNPVTEDGCTHEHTPCTVRGGGCAYCPD